MISLSGWARAVEGPPTVHRQNPIQEHPNRAPKAAPKSITTTSELVGGVEVAFMDGHAAPVKLQQLWTLDWHNNWVAPSTLPAPK